MAKKDQKKNEEERNERRELKLRKKQYIFFDRNEKRYNENKETHQEEKK